MKQETSIKKCTLEEVYNMDEGLVIQGCGGDLGDWVEGITSLLVDKGVTAQNFSFPKVMTFQLEDTINLLFPIEEEGIDIGKLAVWRLENREQYGAVWLSDYKINTLDLDMEEEDLDR